MSLEYPKEMPRRFEGKNLQLKLEPKTGQDAVKMIQNSLEKLK